MASILVVDDEHSMREFLEIMLHKEGYQVATAAGGGEAIDILKKKDFDLVITDIRMKETDGLQVLKKCKEIHPNTVVIMPSIAAENSDSRWPSCTLISAANWNPRKTEMPKKIVPNRTIKVPIPPLRPGGKWMVKPSAVCLNSARPAGRPSAVRSGSSSAMPVGRRFDSARPFVLNTGIS